jgi:glycolate oxidase FAD binding subunit
VLGIGAVTATGERVRFGGKTVKNVSGLDMTKAFIGSLGTLGILVEATVRLLPLPPARATVAVAAEPETLWEVADAVCKSGLYPACITWLPRSFCRMVLSKTTFDEGALAIGLEGTVSGLRERLHSLEGLGRNARQQCLEEADADSLWSRVRDMPLPPADPTRTLTLRIIVPPSNSRRLAELLDARGAYTYLIHSGVGVAWAHWDLDTLAGEPPMLVSALREVVHEWEGHLVVMGGPISIRRQLDVWGLDEAQKGIMEALKIKLDPQRILSPGRWGGF